MNMEEEMEDQPPKPPRRRRWIVAGVIVVVLALVLGEWLASRVIAARLRTLVARKLDAQLDTGTLIYVPPYGAWAWKARLVRNGEELITLKRVKLSLARVPLGDGPIVISRLNLRRPIINLSPGAFEGLLKDDGLKHEPRKLSDVLRLRDVQVSHGRVTYRDPQRPGKPAAWEGIALRIETVQQSPSQYKFHLISRASLTAESSAAGTIDVDALELDVPSFTLKGRAEPKPISSPLPSAVQAFIARHRINGRLMVSGGGKLSLRDPGNAAWKGTIAVEDATATLPLGRTQLDNARLNLFCSREAGAPMHVRLDRIELASRGKSLVIDSGAATVDMDAGTWQVSEFRGHAQFNRTVATSPALLASAPQQQPRWLATTTAINPLDRLDVSGRIDVAGAASGPIDLADKDPWTAIRHEIMAFPRGASFQPKSFARRIEEIRGGEIRLVNGTVVLQELSGKYGDDILRLRGARLPVASLPQVQQWREISGSVTFRPPLRPYTPALDKVLETLSPSGQFFIAGSWTNDKTSGEAKRDYDLMIASDTGSFTLTDRQIVLANLRGDATLVPAGVDVHSAEADVLGGKLRASGHWLRGDVHRYLGDVIVRDIDLARLEERFVEERPRRPMRGRVFGEATLRGEHLNGAGKDLILAGLRGDGQVEVVAGSLFQMPVLKHLTQHLGGLKEATNVGDAAATFVLGDGRVELTNLAVNSPAVGLQGGGAIGTDGTLNLNVVAAPLADWRASLRETKVPVVSDVAGEIAGGVQSILNAATGTLLYQFRIEGSLKEVTVVTIPTPVLTDTAAFVFSQMLAPPKKDRRPIEYLQSRERRVEAR